MSWLAQLVNLTGPGKIFGRSGHVIPLPGDYAASQVSTSSGGWPWSDVAGAIDTLINTGASTTLHSLHGRIGNVNSEEGDYAASQVDNDSTVGGETVADAVDALHARLERKEISVELSPPPAVVSFTTELNAAGFSSANLVMLSSSNANHVFIASLPADPDRSHKTIVNADESRELRFSHLYGTAENLRCPGGTTLTIAPGESVDCYYTDGGIWYLQPGTP